MVVWVSIGSGCGTGDSLPILLLVRQGETELRSPPHRSGGPDASSVPRDNPLYGRQSDAGSGKIGLRMKALEGAKQSVREQVVKSRAIIPDEYFYLFIVSLTAADLDLGPREQRRAYVRGWRGSRPGTGPCGCQTRWQERGYPFRRT